MKVYILTEEQAAQIQSANDNKIMWSPSGHKDIDGLYISEENITHPNFSKHKEIFDTFVDSLPTADIDIYAI